MHPDTPSDPPRQHCALAGETLAYTDEGEGDVVVLAIPGLPGSVRDFRWLAPALGGVRFVRVELPGFGESTRSGAVGMPVAARAAVVLGLMDALSLSSAHLVSHSAGAMIISHIARHHPERVRSATFLASPGPRAHYPMGLYRLFARGLGTAAGRTLLVPLQRRFYRAIGFPSYISDAELTCCTLDAAANDFEKHAADVAAIQAPLLIAWAQDDRIVPAALAEALVAAAPAGPRLGFEVGGHNIQKTHATEIAEAMQRLFSGA